MASRTRKPLHNLAETIHSLLGQKSHLTTSWVKSVCHIIINLPSEEQSTDLRTTNIDTVSASENPDDELGNRTSKITDELAILTARINELNRQRKQFLNEFLDLKGNIRVFCRIRPIEMGENFGRFRPVVALDSSNVLLRFSDNKNKSYSFDKVFHHGSSQDEVFSEVEPVIKSALDGYNACIFAYGQTGTGKTFTMEGIPEDPGMVPRAIEALFKQATDSNHVYLFSFSMLEIYMGNLRDLLISQPTKPMDPMPCLSIHTDPKGEIEIENLVAIRVSGLTQAIKLYRLGCRFRSTASTNCNITSSRSHCLIRISITCSGAPERRRETNKVWFVDLGGSERLLKTKASGRRLEEGKAINLSLSSLGDVINALQLRKGHVPYRNSKLTQVLKDSLGRDSKTLMLVHVSPKEEDLCETVCSLNFATRARTIHLGNTDSTEQREKEVAMMNLQEMMNKIEVERQDVRMRIKQSTQELQILRSTAACSTEQLDNSVDAYQLMNEVPQPNLERNRNNTAYISAPPLSQVPRFMRPTVCSRRKSGSDHLLTTEEKLEFPARRRRPFNHYAKSVNFPVKGISGNNSEGSISRNSCLVPLTVNKSADVETNYSQDLSECDIKEVVSPDQVTSSKCLNQHRYHVVHGEGSENGDKSNACSGKHLKVDKWLCQKNAPASRSHVYRNKRILAIPTPEKKLMCKGQKETEKFQDEKVNNYKLAVEQIVNHNKSGKHVDVEEMFMQEVNISKPPANMNVNDNIDPKCHSDSLSDGIVKETMINVQHKLDDELTEKHMLSSIYPPDIWCCNFNSTQDDNGVNCLSTMQAVYGETECSDSSLSNSSNWCQISTIDLADSIWDARQDSNISISRIEQKSGCQRLPIVIGVDDSEKEDLEKLSQSSGEGTCLQKVRSQRALLMKNVILEEPVKPQQLTRSQDNNVHLGICNLLQQKIQILWAGALLGLGFQNLGLEQEFFLGLML
ncbi:putative minus-end-directed kinesin ATPase [Rosa chinensis]|uniref:Putative minus-end-directed kinesin ATPase n=1 Tax=Rosa chinensis TaxID=74649 RepID=A0A2P6QNR3_ROSCH|nr:kinesin-like protein KIN-14T [Rosa chinensis]XP_024159128.1 kinesin-like protein KIN-14T [Rosa chinensis]XP_040362640.1 kinesin-like protein KIN-14T [Rosa chinensis]XP_040362641.1 kinesin-like protein KIN-14T [Rosa chinensis]XP_040362642.1 kinesin-like protein KIN-14T [Rosa chinensis]PRQ35821.1 putative minus-end-directed kinesin ATPase [Rosa chinensis]